MLLYEIFEGTNPMGGHETEETAIFKKISSFDCEQLDFSKNTPKKAKSLITGFLQVDCTRRLGYDGSEQMRGKKAFADVSWKTVGKDTTIAMELVGHCEPLAEADLGVFDKPSAFDEY